MTINTLLALAAVLAGAASQPPAEVEPTQEQPPAGEQAPAPAQPAAPSPTSAPAAPAPGTSGDPLVNLAGSLPAKAVFRQLLDAVREAKSLVFHVKTTNSGYLAGHAADTDTSVKMRRLTERAGAWQLRISGTGIHKGDEQSTTIDVVWGPTGAAWLDHAKKTLNERPVAQSTGPLVQMALSSVPTQLIEKTPFTKEINSLVVTLDATESVDGVDCQVLTFKPKKGSSTTRVWVATSDHLPRKFERSNELKQYASTTIVEFSDLRVDEALTPEDFKLDLPEGFERETVWTSQRNVPREPAVRAEGAANPEAESPASPPPPGAGHEADRLKRSRPAAPPAPAFDLVTPAGEHITLAKLKGKTVVLYFWGTWSLPGRAGIEELQKIQDELGVDKVRTLAVAVRERSKDAPAEFMKAGSRTVTLLLDGDKTAAEYGVVVFPTFVVLNADGVKVGQIEGFRKNSTAEDVRTLITNATPESTPVTAADGARPGAGT